MLTAGFARWLGRGRGKRHTIAGFVASVPCDSRFPDSLSAVLPVRFIEFRTIQTADIATVVRLGSARLCQFNRIGEKPMYFRRFVLPALATLVAAMLALPAMAQSFTTGDITGIISDPSGAVLPNVKVTLKNNGTNATQSQNTNASGVYRFALLNPGDYTVSATGAGFQTSKEVVTIRVGQASTANLQLALAAASQTVEVSAAGGVIQTETGNISTNLSPEQIANIPNPGNDLTYFVQTAPGATMNTQAGYGNSATYGISGTSNLFTVDGENENDPFLNLSNSGATNLLLGANDVQEATVVNNGYTGQYGGLAGANVNYVTRSGGNGFHGNAEYFWDGSTMNANDWFNDHTTPVTARPFVNANQWAASVGGPIVKNKTFFFVNTEGLRILLPAVQPVNIPSPQFQAATLANLASAGSSGEIPFYSHLFSLYNNAPGVARAANILPGGGCSGFSSPLLGSAPCALQYQSSIDNLSDEWLITGRVDQTIGNNDRAFLHFRTDHGLQASYTDPLSPTFNDQSIQPQYEGQFQENHTFGASAVNQFIVAGSWYSAIFQPPNLSAATTAMPYQLAFAGGPPNGLLYTPGGFFYNTEPQGRNTTQYQIEDDYAWQKGNHSLKFGVNFRRNDITDYTPGGFFATIPTAIFNSLGSFFNGTADTFEQAFDTRPTEPIALYSLGFYAQDEWAVRPRLKLTLSLRAEHNSDPVCQTNCFARLTNSFFDISHDPTQPYNQAIQTGLNQALPNYQSISWEPRFGFAWQPFGNGNTVVRGGVGIFADIFPGTIATSFDTNSPLKNTFVASGLQLAPGLPGSAQTATTASNAAFVSGFQSGLNIGQIESGPGGALFSPPTFVNSVRSVSYPTYQEWNLEVQQALGSKMSFSLNYVGNHGSDLALVNPGLNSYCNSGAVPFQPAGLPPCLSALGVSSFVGLPTAPTDPRFSTVTEVSNQGVSNYNGLTVGFTRKISNSLQVNASYTWSHALDDISNGGFLPFNFDTNTSVLGPQNPFNFRQYNYGNADYDVRHQFNLNYVYTTPRFHGWLNPLLDWTVSGTIFARTGLPFTVVDGAATGALGSYNYGPATGLDLFANSSVGPLSCGSSAAITPCMTASEFTSPVSSGGIASFGNQRRNQIYGPMFFDTDLTLMKNFHIPHTEHAEFQVGAQAFNLFNHPNFDQPVNNIASAQFGSIIRTVGPPTSLFGSFLGGDASPRAVQIKAQIRF
jgi:carboxypeptidase family protein